MNRPKIPFSPHTSSPVTPPGFSPLGEGSPRRGGAYPAAACSYPACERPTGGALVVGLSPAHNLFSRSLACSTAFHGYSKPGFSVGVSLVGCWRFRPDRTRSGRSPPGSIGVKSARQITMQICPEIRIPVRRGSARSEGILPDVPEGDEAIPCAKFLSAFFTFGRVDLWDCFSSQAVA